MKALIRYSKLYLHFWKMAFSWGAMYRVDTLLLFVCVTIIVLSQTVFFNLIFTPGMTVGGWGFTELLLLLAVYQVSWGVFKVFYGKTMEDVMDKIFTGQYDYCLLRPINERFLSYCLPPLIKSLPSLSASFLFLFWVIYQYQINISAATAILFSFYMFIGQVIIFSFAQAAVTTAFFTNWSNDIYGVFESSWESSRFPGEAFTGGIYSLLTYVLPITLFVSFPTKVLLGHVGSSPWEWLAPIGIAAIFLLISNAYYKFGISRYTSASS